VELYRRGKTWWVTFYIENRRYRISTKHNKKSAAYEAAGKMMEMVCAAEPVVAPVQVPTLRELAEGRFSEWVNGSMRLKPKSKEYYLYGCDMLKATNLVNMRIDQITREDVDCLNVGGSASNENCARRTLRRMLRLAMDWGLTDRICKVILLEEQGREATVDAIMEQAIQDTAGGGVFQVAWPVSLDTGLRPKELASLLIPDIDFVRGVITVRRPTTKSPAGKREVAMSARVVGLLLAHLAGRSEGWAFLSPRYPGRHISAAALTQAFARARTRAGVKKEVKLYAARHTFGTDMMESLGNPAAVMKLMGHADLKTTMRYMHPKMTNVAEALDARNETRLRHLNSGHNFGHTPTVVQ
jgi:integrase